MVISLLGAQGTLQRPFLIRTFVWMLPGTRFERQPNHTTVGKVFDLPGILLSCISCKPLCPEGKRLPGAPRPRRTIAAACTLEALG